MRNSWEVEEGERWVILGPNGAGKTTLLQLAGASALNNVYYTNHYSSLDTDNAKVGEFIANFKAKYNEVPDAMGVLGYDCAKVLIAAMKSAGTTEGPKLRDAIAATKDFPGVSGLITINAERNATKSAVVLKIEGGKLRFKETINP